MLIETPKNNRIRAVVVEDSRLCRAILSDMLTDAGMVVEAAATLQEARSLVRTWRPDLVLLDQCLPDGSGLELLEAHRGDDDAPAFILISAFSNPNDRIRALNLGAADCVTKPYVPEELLIRIQRQLQVRQQFRSLASERTHMEAQLGTVASLMVPTFEQVKQRLDLRWDEAMLMERPIGMIMVGVIDEQLNLLRDSDVGRLIQARTRANEFVFATPDDACAVMLVGSDPKQTLAAALRLGREVEKLLATRRDNTARAVYGFAHVEHDAAEGPRDLLAEARRRLRPIRTAAAVGRRASSPVRHQGPAAAAATPVASVEVLRLTA